MSGAQFGHRGRKRQRNGAPLIPGPRPWAARFRDGPCVEDFRVWAVGGPWQEIVVAPIPSHLEGPGGAAYVIVGGDGAPRAPEDPPWPEEVVYRLAEAEELEIEGEPGTLAWYEVAS